MANDVFDHHYGAVYHHAEVQGSKGKKIGRNVSQIEADGGEQEREWNGERNDNGAAHVAEEEEENDGDQNHALGKVALHSLHRELHQIGTVEERHNLNALRQNAVIQLVDFLVDFLEDGVGVVPLLQEHNALNRVGVIDNRSIWPVCRFPDLAQADLGTLRHGSDVPDADGRSILCFHYRLLDVLHVRKKAHRLHIDLLRSLLDEAAAAVGVVVGDLVFDLPDAQPVRDELFGIKPDLVLLGRPAEARYIDDTLHAFEGFLQEPILERFLFHHVVGRVCAFERVPVDLPDRAPVGAHLRNQVGGKVHLAESFQHVLTIHVAGGVVIEDQHEAGKAGERG